MSRTIIAPPVLFKGGTVVAYRHDLAAIRWASDGIAGLWRAA